MEHKNSKFFAQLVKRFEEAKTEIFKAELFTNGLHNEKEREELYYRYGKLHRNNKPAHILYNKNDEVFFEAYYKNGLLHRYPLKKRNTYIT
jgi:hypothetical protein